MYFLCIFIDLLVSFYPTKMQDDCCYSTKTQHYCLTIKILSITSNLDLFSHLVYYLTQNCRYKTQEEVVVISFHQVEAKVVFSHLFLVHALVLMVGTAHRPPTLSLSTVKFSLQYTTHNKIMLSQQSHYNTPPRMPDQLQDIYSDQARHFLNQQKTRKRLYSQLIQKSNQRLNQKRALERNLNQQQNKQIDLFWKNQQQRLQNMQHKRRQQIEQTRRINNDKLKQQMHRSAVIQPYHLNRNYMDDLAILHERQVLKKQQQKRFYQQSMQMYSARKQKEMLQRSLQLQIYKKKQMQQRQSDNKRAQFYQNLRKKYMVQHHSQVTQQLRDVNQKKKRQQAQLQHLVAVKGGQELNQRVAAQRMVQLQQQQAQKVKFVNDIKQQVEDNTYKAAIDRYLQLKHQRNIISQTNQNLARRDEMENQRKRKQQEEMRAVLKNQMKPRSLVPQPYPVQQAGIGSPAHIGKIVHDDRLRQLKWLQRNLVNEVNQM